MPTRHPHDRRPHLVKRPDCATWQLLYYIPGRAAPVRESTHTTDATQAEAIRAAKEHEIGAAALGYTTLATPAQAHVTVGACLDLLEPNYKLRGLDWATAKYHVRRARLAFGHFPALSLTKTLVSTQVLKWLEDRAPATANRALAALYRSLTLACEDDLLPRMPKCKIDWLDEDNHRQGFFERAEYEGLRREFGRRSESDLQDVLDWGWCNGWRAKEVRRVQWSSWNGETWSLRLERKNVKGKIKHRTVYCDEGENRRIMERRLAARRRWPDCPFIFHRDGQPLGDFRKAWNAAWIAAGLPLYPSPTRAQPDRIWPRQYHDLRRTVSRNLTLAGVDRQRAMEITGHTTESTFEDYDIKIGDDQREAQRKRAAYVAQLPRRTTVVPLTRRQTG
jgi:integrase